MIISVDFDDTLKINGKPNIGLIEHLKANQRAGNIIILNTCRQGKRLANAVSFCRQYGLVFHAVNENVPVAVKMLGYNPRKIYADLYIDDKAIKP